MNVKHLSSWGYVLVWLLLMALTLTSLLLSRAHLGADDTVAALGIAAVKTLLVLLFFMHLLAHRVTDALVLLVVGLFLVLLVSLMVADVETRTTFPRGPVPAAPPAPLPEN